MLGDVHHRTHLFCVYCRLLYERNISPQMVRDSRDALILQVRSTQAVAAKTRNWIESTFGTQQGLELNSQAFRNHIFSAGYSSTSLLEQMFGHVKEDQQQELKNGMLCDCLAKVFFFLEVRLGNIAIDLKAILAKNKFMEDHPPKRPDEKPTTGYRWQMQVRIVWWWCTSHSFMIRVVTRYRQVNAIPSCVIQAKVGDNIVISHQIEHGRDKKPCTVVHIASLEGFLWQDSADNVPPSCCCPVNRNGKDVCCGIMVALQQHPKFSAWFQKTWFKKELLARRLRGDLDPFADIQQRQGAIAARQLQQKESTEAIDATATGFQPRSAALVPDPADIMSDLQQTLNKAKYDPALLVFLARTVHNCGLTVQGRLDDDAIAMRQLGKSSTPSVAYTKPAAQPKRRKSALAEPASSMFQPSQRSDIQQIKAHSKKKRGTHGNASHLPLTDQTFCECCCKHIATASFGQHTDSQKHNTALMSGAKCKCPQAFVTYDTSSLQQFGGAMFASRVSLYLLSIFALPRLRLECHLRLLLLHLKFDCIIAMLAIRT